MDGVPGYSSTRRRLLGGLLGVGAGWPLVRHGVVQAFDASDPAVAPPVKYGLTADRIAGDAAPELNRQIRAAAAAGGTLKIPKGVYPLASPLVLVSGISLECAPGAVFVRTFSTGGQFDNATLTSRDANARIRGVRVKGGTFTCSAPSMLGKVICILGDDIELSGVVIDGFNGGQGMSLAGDRIRVDSCTVTTSEGRFGNGGIRFFGGADFLCTRTKVVSGDDALQFVPVPTRGGRKTSLTDLSCVRGVYRDCEAISLAARACIAAMSERDGELTASIKDCRFESIKGQGGNRTVVVANDNSSGTVDGVVFEDCTFSDRKQIELAESYRIAHARNVTFRRCRLTGAQRSLLSVRDSADVRFEATTIMRERHNPRCDKQSIVVERSERVVFSRDSRLPDGWEDDRRKGPVTAECRSPVVAEKFAAPGRSPREGAGDLVE